MVRRGRPVEDRYLVARSLKLGQAELTQSGALLLRSPQVAPLTNERFSASDGTELPYPGSPLRPMARGQADFLFQRVIKRVLAGEHFDASGFVGNHAVELYSRSPWHALFARHFLEPALPTFLAPSESQALRIYHDPTTPPSQFGDYEGDTLVLFDLRELRALVLGTAHAGEIRHTVYTLANYLLPRQGLLGLHAAAALSGDGTATLVLGRADRALRADFLKGYPLLAESATLWTEAGLSRLEASLYTELSAEANVGEGILLEGARATGGGAEVLRGAPPLPSSASAGIKPLRPTRMVLLSHDPTGALPLLSLLTQEQARYHFLAGYGSRALAPFERGGDFNPCFAHHCLPLPPQEYAALFAACVQREAPEIFLLNTGKVRAGSVPREISLRLLRAIHEGRLENATFAREPVLRLQAATALAGVEARWLAQADEEVSRALAERFTEYFQDRGWAEAGVTAK